MATDDDAEDTVNARYVHETLGASHKKVGKIHALGDMLAAEMDRVDALERKQASQQEWCDNFDRVMALVESKVRKLQEGTEQRLNALEVRLRHVPAGGAAAGGFDVNRVKCLEDRQGILLDEVAKLKNRADSNHSNTCSVANAVHQLQDEVAKVKKNAEGQTGYVASISLRVNDLENAAERFQRAAPALDPRLAKYLEVGGKYLLVEPSDSAAGREWKATVGRETENDAPDEYGNAYAASPGEAVAALVAKLVKHKEL